MTNFDVKLIDFIHKYSTFWLKKSAVPVSTAIILVSKRF